jgi:hypothetical protein
MILDFLCTSTVKSPNCAYHPGTREFFCASTRCPVILPAQNLYSSLKYLVLAIRACANRRATFAHGNCSQQLPSLSAVPWHMRYSPIGAAY